MAVAPGPNGADDDSIVSTVDGEGPESEYVIADITADEAWIAMDAEDAPELTSWR